MRMGKGMQWLRIIAIHYIDKITNRNPDTDRCFKPPPPPIQR